MKPHLSKPAGRWLRFFSQRARVLALVLLVFQATTSSGHAQVSAPSDEQMVKTMPGPDTPHPNSPAWTTGYVGPYARWPHGVPVSVTVLTDHQVGKCVDLAIAEIRHHWDLVRHEIPAFSTSPDLTVSDELPATLNDQMVVIGLPTGRPMMRETLERLALQKFGQDHLVGGTAYLGGDIAQSSSERLAAVENGTIKFALTDKENQEGMLYYGKDYCEGWAFFLYDALGTYNLRFGFGLDSEKRNYADSLPLEYAFRRLFLQVLDAMPEGFNVGQLGQDHLLEKTTHDGENATLYESGASPWSVFKTIVAAENSSIKFAINWRDNWGGMSYAEEVCKTQFWAASLYDPLGGYNLKPGFALDFDKRVYEDWESVDFAFRRLFLHVLDAMPEGFDIGQLRQAFRLRYVEADQYHAPLYVPPPSRRR